MNAFGYRHSVRGSAIGVETSASGPNWHLDAAIQYLSHPSIVARKPFRLLQQEEAGNQNIHPPFIYQTTQGCSGIIGWPLRQPKALPNSSKFCTAPLVRNMPGE